MSSHAEDVLYASLTDTDAMEYLVREGLAIECIPTEMMRPVVSWAVDEFFRSGRTKAPSRAALETTWGETLEAAEIELPDEDVELDNIEWAIDELKGRYVHLGFTQFLKTAAVEMQNASPTEKVAALAEQANHLFNLSLKLQSRSRQTEAVRGYEDAIRTYEIREREGHTTRGMTFGLKEIDDHTYGIHPGEVATLAAPPKTGKSMAVDLFGLNEWKAGKETVIYTLENSVEMTIDRIVCLHLGINARKWARGECDVTDVDRVRTFLAERGDEMRDGLHILQPEPGRRTMQAMIRQAQILGAESVFIDQLTFVEHPDPGRKARHEIIRDLMHDLKTLVQSDRHPLSCLIAHQINREGVKAARKAGYLEMDMLAEGSEVERTSDWVFGLLQSKDQKIAQEALFQILAARREEQKAWRLSWRPADGFIGALGEATFDE